MKFDEMTKEELIDYINSLNEDNNGKYGLIWDREKEPEKIVVDCDKYIPILLENKNQNINKEEPNNLLIEGDNFHSLSVLNYTHKEAIDVIYIDPPYNTGNKDFIYNDRFVDLEDGYRHSKWLNFMEKRLRLARNLLKDTGHIFISIDDNEMAQLKLLCDKIFGENNFVSCFTWVRKKKGSFLSNSVRKMTEYILCYKKDKNSDIKFYGEKAYSDKYQPIVKRTNNIKQLIFPSNIIKTSLKDDIYKKGFYGNDGTGINILNDFKVSNGVIENELKVEGHFTWQQSYLDNEIKQGTEITLSNKFGFNVLRFDQESKIKTPSTLITIENGVGTNEDATLELQKMFNMQPNEVFSYSKPTSLIKYLVKMVTYQNPNAIVLDFFAGSGTTGQAVLELNDEDGGNRQFIVCTNNENNICGQFTYPRLEKTLNGYQERNGLKGSLKYYKTEFVDYAGTRDQLYYDLTEKCIPMLCVKSNTYELVEKNKEYIIYSNKNKTNYSCVYFDIFGESYDSFINKVKEIKEHKNLYIFSLSEYVNEESFKGILNYSIEPIPYKILDLYKNVVKMSKEN